MNTDDSPDIESLYDPDGTRVQKLLAAAGVGPRRVCEDLIAAGRVTLNGMVLTELGMRVNSQVKIAVDGMRIVTDHSLLTLAFNKPAGVVSAMSDPQGRPCLGDFAGAEEVRLFHVGRLDIDTEGLIILTNDGELGHRLTHPSFEIPKTYLAQVSGKVSPSLGKLLLKGIELEDGPISADRFVVKETLGNESIVLITLHSGRNRIVRRMLDHVGHPVNRLVRLSIGSLRLGSLKPGNSREVTGKELSQLLHEVGL